VPRLKGWIAALAADPAAILFVVAVVLLIAILVGMALAARARRRDDHRERVEPAPEGSGPIAIAPWVEEGRQLFTHWQDRIERLGELQGRLAAMAQEIEQLKAQAGAQAGRIDELRAENLRLGQEAEAFSMERDQLRAVLARISELVRQASEPRPSDAGGATPAVGP
jgi:peptidoglycan hydrolase CwlO-like protein